MPLLNTNTAGTRTIMSESDDLSIEREPLAARIAGRLREWILVGKLLPGDFITERAIAERLGVSRTPLREALRLLAKEGLVEMQPNRRPKIADPSLTQIGELLEVQSALEALAGTLCVTRATDRQIREITEIHHRLEEMSYSSDPLDFFRQDMAFHTAIVEAAGNEALAETHRQYNAALFRARFLSSRRMERRDVTMQQHRDIMTAIAHRDAGQAAAALKAHLVRAQRNIVEVTTGVLASVDGSDA